MKYRQQTIDNPFRAPVFGCAKTGSTMTDALRFVKRGAVHGTLLISDRQTRGRGRGTGRRWISGTGDSLLATLILDANELPFDQHLLPLAAGSAVAQMCSDAFNVNAEVCWPNDVLVGGRKLSGILCECRGDKIFCGVGINLHQTDFAGNYRRPPVSFKQLGQDVTVADCATAFLDAFYKVIQERQWIDKLLIPRLSDLGQEVRFRPGEVASEKIVEGIFEGLDSQGAVRIRLYNKEEKYICGEFLAQPPSGSVAGDPVDKKNG